jgi:hypothetical protein
MSHALEEHLARVIEKLKSACVTAKMNGELFACSIRTEDLETLLALLPAARTEGREVEVALRDGLRLHNEMFPAARAGEDVVENLADELRNAHYKHIGRPRQLHWKDLPEYRRDRWRVLAHTAASLLRLPEAAPGGFQLAPKEPTIAMVRAAHDAKIFLNMSDHGWRLAYKAMLTAAPAPSAGIEPTPSVEDLEAAILRGLDKCGLRLSKVVNTNSNLGMEPGYALARQIKASITPANLIASATTPTPSADTRDEP